jgi:predicted HAD superfamily phosphohydrolase YqeG
LRTTYQRLSDPDAVIRGLGQIAPRTVVVDIEPLIAAWDSGQPSLSHGVTHFLDQVSTVRELAAVCFATNSRRRLPAAVTSGRQDVRYLASACKPLRTAPYQNLPKPGVVIGDQVATDGVLAWRLGYSISRIPSASHPAQNAVTVNTVDTNLMAAIGVNPLTVNTPPNDRITGVASNWVNGSNRAIPHFLTPGRTPAWGPCWGCEPVTSGGRR